MECTEQTCTIYSPEVDRSGQPFLSISVSTGGELYLAEDASYYFLFPQKDLFDLDSFPYIICLLLICGEVVSPMLLHWRQLYTPNNDLPNVQLVSNGQVLTGEGN